MTPTEVKAWYRLAKHNFEEAKKSGNKRVEMDCQKVLNDLTQYMDLSKIEYEK